MNTKIIISVVIITLVLGAIFVIGKRGDSNQSLSVADKESATRIAQEATPTTSNKAPNFNLQDYNGKTISLADFAGKPLVINSWAAWCPFCRKELVDFAVVQKELGNAVTIIAINRAEPVETAKQYTDELGVTESLIFLLDPKDSFYQSIGGFSMPETIFVNTKGETVFHKRGPMDLTEMKEKIQQLISQ